MAKAKKVKYTFPETLDFKKHPINTIKDFNKVLTTIDKENIRILNNMKKNPSQAKELFEAQKELSEIMFSLDPILERLKKQILKKPKTKL